MPSIPMPKGALAMLVLRVLRSGPLHGYAIAQRIRQLSSDVLEAEDVLVVNQRRVFRIEL